MRLLVIAFFLIVGAAWASEVPESCVRIHQFDEINSVLVVVCPGLPELTQGEQAAIVENVLDAYTGPPDELLIDFVSDTDSNELLGSYYTHSGFLTLWPKDETRKQVVVLHERTIAT